MPNVNEWKAKLVGLKNKLLEKTDKIGLLRAWRANAAPATEENPENSASPKKNNLYSLNSIFREGSTATRLQVLAFYLFILIALVSAGSLFKKMADKMRNSGAGEKLNKEYTHEFSEAMRKAAEKNDMLALGQFTANAYSDSSSEAQMMRLDIWIRVSDQGTASMITSKNEIFRDKTVGALNELYMEKVSLLEYSGKIEAREKIKEALNSALKNGRVEEVFIQNLVVQ